MSYLCENSVGPEKPCDFRSGKVILQQPIEATQMEKLLNEGRTDVLRGFVSNRTRRKFSAFLVRKPDGTIGFEFEPRAAKAGAPAKRAGQDHNGTVEAAPAAKPSKTRVRSAVVAGATAVSPVKSKQARKVSGAAARKPVAQHRAHLQRKKAGGATLVVSCG